MENKTKKDFMLADLNNGIAEVTEQVIKQAIKDIDAEFIKQSVEWGKFPPLMTVSGTVKIEFPKGYYVSIVWKNNPKIIEAINNEYGAIGYKLTDDCEEYPFVCLKKVLKNGE